MFDQPPAVTEPGGVPATTGSVPAAGRPRGLLRWASTTRAWRLAAGVARGRRRGSVLILVVALLVLLALIGTAFITSAGNDRTASVQHVYNTQLELLAEGVLESAKAMILADIAPVDPPTTPPAPPIGKGAFRPATPTAAVAGAAPVPTTVSPTVVPLYYTNVDYVKWDPFLAERYPSVPAAGSPSAGQPVEWKFVSASPLARTRDTSNPDLFLNQYASPLVSGSSPRQYSSRAHLVPTSLTVPTPTGVNRIYPAFLITDTADTGNAGQTVLAADADGDGIADSPYIELPLGQVNGVRFYGAVRTIDNTAAINVSTAWGNATPADQAVMPDLTPANVGLQQMLDQTDPNQFDPPFNTYRFGGQTAPNAQPFRDAPAAPDSSFAFSTKYDAFWTMLGSRLDNPGYLNAGVKYRALGLSESAALARRFCLADPNGSQGQLDLYFPNAARGAAVNRQPFLPSQAATWFNSIFDYENLAAANVPIRPLVTGHNAVGNMVPSFVGRPNELVNPELTPTSTPTEVHAYELQRNGQYRYRGGYNAGARYCIGEWVQYGGFSYVAIARGMGHAPDAANGEGLLYWARVPWTYNPVKINPNTASYGELLAAYYAVMADGPNTIIPNVTKDIGYGSTVIGTFQNPVRSGGITLSSEMVKQLRAAQAAVNTIDLRDADDDVTSRKVILTDDDFTTTVEATVYGTERQPYITEALVHVTETDLPYVAIELFNPYPTEINLSSFRFAYRSRLTPAAPIEIGKLAGTIPGYGYRYFESAAADRPPAPSNFTAPTPTEDVPNLKECVLGGGVRELLLLRRRATPTAAGTEFSNKVANNPSTYKANEFNEALLEDLVPADQLDFVGIAPGLPLSTQKVNPTTNLPESYVTRFHYRRATARDTGAGPLNTGTNPWHCVYGGPYMSLTGPAQANLRRQWGWVRDMWPPTRADVTTCTPPGWGDKKQLTAAEPGRDDFVIAAGGTSAVATYRTRTVQLNAEGMPGPWKPGSSGATPTRFPFGGFARVGDLLAVTYIGANRIGTVAATAEMNSPSMDSAMAEDGDAQDDREGNFPLEQLGRFAPILFGGIDDLANLRAQPDAPLDNQRFAWARDLFDYFTVNCPQDDYQANVDLSLAAGSTTTSGDPTLPVDPTYNKPKWVGGMPQAVANGPAATDPLKANLDLENTAATHGLINVNTANWKVLSTLPFTTDPVKNANVAKMIVAHREQYGPFLNLFDLQKVGVAPLTTPPAPPATPIAFRDATGPANAFNPQLTDGDLSPYGGNNSAGATDDGVVGDFESRYLTLTRISNMVTFRSDSFTVYVLVQGWRNAGTATPELVAQRRIAAVVDRSTVRPELGAAPPAAGVDLNVTSMSTTNIPNN